MNGVNGIVRKALLSCGVVSSVLYAAATFVGALRWEGYSSISQTVSELFAIDAPSRPLVVPLFLTYSVLVITFGLGVWGAARGNRALRIVGGLLVVNEARGIVGTLFAPMHLRGVAGTSSDTWHMILTVVNVLCILFIIGLGATAFGTWFRRYSLGTILLLVVFGTLAGLDGPRLAANLPTPWMGVTERINIFGYMLWVAVLAVGLWRAEGTVARSEREKLRAIPQQGMPLAS
ncbi:MAG: DUF998 domain-containing protein [Thermomicrobiales bacterium]